MNSPKLFAFHIYLANGFDISRFQDRRQQRLDHFFREAYARAFDQPKLSDSENREHDIDDILNQTITKYCELPPLVLRTGLEMGYFQERTGTGYGYEGE